MVTPLHPIIGNWYRDTRSGDIFEVVALDDAAETVDIQTFDGDIDEMDLATWHASNLETIDPPEDPAGSIDANAEDLGYEDLDALTGTDETSYEEALDSYADERLIGLDEEE